MSNTPPLVAAAAGVPQRADPLPLAPVMAVPWRFSDAGRHAAWISL